MSTSSSVSSVIIDSKTGKIKFLGGAKKERETKAERKQRRQRLLEHIDLFETLGPTLGVSVRKKTEDDDIDSLDLDNVGDEDYNFEIGAEDDLDLGDEIVV